MKACERCAAKPIDGLVVVAHRKNVPQLARQQLQQPHLRDVGVLKLVHQDVAKALLQRFAQRRVRFQQRHRAGDQRSKRDALLFAQQLLAGAVRARDFLLPRNHLLSFSQRVGIQKRAFFLQFARERVRVLLVIAGGNQFILAAREKLHKVAQEFSGLREPTVFVELQPREIPPQQDPMVLPAQQHPLRVCIFE